MIASFCTAVLVHAYIPMPLIAGPLWLAGIVVGTRRRQAGDGRGFPGWAWGASGLIIFLFMLPMLLDMVLNPPGNVMLILQRAVHPIVQTPAPTPLMLLHMLDSGAYRLPHNGLLLALVSIGIEV